MSNLQTYYHFKLDFQKVDQHTGGKWLIHGTKRRKDNQLQSLELPCMISTLEQRTPKHQSDWLYGNGGAADQCTMSQVPIFIPWHREYWNI